MSPVQLLREFISERLLAAAEEICRELEKTIQHFQREAERPGPGTGTPPPGRPVYTHGAGVPQSPGRKEEKPAAQADLRSEDTGPRWGEGHTDPPQVKEEPGEALPQLKQEVDSFLVTVSFEGCELGGVEPSGERQDRGSPGRAGPAQAERGFTPDGNTAEREFENASTSGTSQLAACERPAPRKPGSIHAARQRRRPAGAKRGRKPSESPKTCQYCGKYCSNYGNLKVHERVHTGEKPFSCHVCGKKFPQNSGVLRHMKTHTGEKPFSCQTCGKCFGYKADMLRHSRVHTGERPFPCPVCERHFRLNSQMKSHIRKLHKDWNAHSQTH